MRRPQRDRGVPVRSTTERRARNSSSRRARGEIRIGRRRRATGCSSTRMVSLARLPRSGLRLAQCRRKRGCREQPRHQQIRARPMGSFTISICGIVHETAPGASTRIRIEMCTASRLGLGVQEPNADRVFHFSLLSNTAVLGGGELLQACRLRADFVAVEHLGRLDGDLATALEAVEHCNQL